MASKRAIRRHVMKRDRRKSCRGKVAYPSRDAADAMAQERGAAIGQQLAAYRCRYCPAWHYGHLRAEVAS